MITSSAEDYSNWIVSSKLRQTTTLPATRSCTWGAGCHIVTFLNGGHSREHETLLMEEAGQKANREGGEDQNALERDLSRDLITFSHDPETKQGTVPNGTW